VGLKIKFSYIFVKIYRDDSSHECGNLPTYRDEIEIPAYAGITQFEVYQHILKILLEYSEFVILNGTK